MATTFKPTGKVPYTLTWIGKSGNVTTDPVTNITSTVSDANVVSVLSDPEPRTGWFLGNPAVTVATPATVTFNGTNSLGEAVTGQIVVTVDPATVPPPPVDVAGSIGIVLGDEIPQ